MTRLNVFAVASALLVASGGCTSEDQSDLAVGTQALTATDEVGDEGSCTELVQQTQDANDPSSLVHCVGPHQGRSLIGAAFSATVDASLDLVAPSWSNGEVHGLLDGPVGVDDYGIDARIGGLRLADADLQGLVFSLRTPANEVRAVRIALSGGFEADAVGRGRYQVEYQNASNDWRPYCAVGQYAYAVPGHFVAGHFIHGDLTFACQNSAAAKAMRWGYAPYTGTAPLSLGLFEVATRLARADYCGHDTAHTIDGTDVLVYDVGEPRGEVALDSIDSPASPATTPAFKFEAAWAVQFPRQSHALCLSKLRWQMLPPDFCGDDLPDPRTRINGQYCEDLGEIQSDNFRGFLLRLKAQGALMFSSSRYNEVGLWNWFGSQNRTISTTSGFWAGNEGGISTPPRVNSQAGVFSISPSQQGFVAVVSAEPHAGMAPLRLYFNNATKTYRTSIRPPASWCGPSACSSNSWVSTGTIVGYVFADITQARGVRAIALRTWSTAEGPDIEQAKYILLPEGKAGKVPYTHLVAATEGYAFASDQ